MRQCDEINKSNKFKNILRNDYNNTESRADIIYNWMTDNKQNSFVQSLGNNWLRLLVRSERERILFR